MWQILVPCICYLTTAKGVDILAFENTTGYRIMHYTCFQGICTVLLKCMYCTCRQDLIGSTNGEIDSSRRWFINWDLWTTYTCSLNLQILVSQISISIACSVSLAYCLASRPRPANYLQVYGQSLLNVYAAQRWRKGIPKPFSCACRTLLLTLLWVNPIIAV